MGDHSVAPEQRSIAFSSIKTVGDFQPLLQQAVIVIGNEKPIEKRLVVGDWKSLWIKTIAAFVLMCYLIILLLVAYRYQLHPPKSEEYGIKFPPRCDSPSRIVHFTRSEEPKYGWFPFRLFAYNYITEIHDAVRSNGTFNRGDALISVNGKNVEGLHRLDVLDALYSTSIGEVELVIKTCPEALEKYEKCKKKYPDYRYIHYPYRPIDRVRRCEAEGWNDVDTSSIFEDLYRNILYVIHYQAFWRTCGCCPHDQYHTHVSCLVCHSSFFTISGILSIFR